MKTIFSFLCAIGVALLLLAGCSDIMKYSDVPEIKFQKLFFKDFKDDLGNVINKAVLTFSFVDGNGDLGVIPGDENTVSQIHYIWQKKLSATEYEDFIFYVEDETQHFIPWDDVMDKRDAQNKFLKGVIEIELVTPLFGLEELDIMRVVFYIVDRAGNQSNIERTPDFSILDRTAIIQ